jgi:hypothetical protein
MLNKYLVDLQNHAIDSSRWISSEIQGVKFEELGDENDQSERMHCVVYYQQLPIGVVSMIGEFFNRLWWVASFDGLTWSEPTPSINQAVRLLQPPPIVA